MDAVELTARDIQIARPLGAAGQHDHVGVVQQRRYRQGRRRPRAGAERDAFGLHLLDAPVDQELLHLEVGNAVAQQAADTVTLFEQRHSMPGARKLLRTGQARRTEPTTAIRLTNT